MQTMTFVIQTTYHFGLYATSHHHDTAIQWRPKMIASGIRIGEASHPGPRPCSTFNCAITNPTTISGKLDVYEELLRDEQLDLVTASETAATLVTQRKFSHDMHGNGYKVLWSPPVQEFRSRIDGQESVRGKAMGVAVMTHYPTRHIEGTISPEWQMTSRIIHTAVDINGTHVQCITLYGLACGNAHAQDYTCELLGIALQALDQVNLPYMILGDFNLGPMNCPLTDTFRQRNMKDLSFLHRELFHSEMPMTCKGATRPDTALFSCEVAAWVSHIHVLDPDHFDAHKIGRAHV